MAYTEFKSVDFGSDRSSIFPSYTVIGTTGNIITPATTGGVINLGDGLYGTLVTFPTDFQGCIKWSTEEFTDRLYAIEDVNAVTSAPTGLIAEAVWLHASRSLTNLNAVSGQVSYLAANGVLLDPTKKLYTDAAGHVIATVSSGGGGGGAGSSALGSTFYNRWGPTPGQPF
jgi:hypothetical protein